MKRRILPTHLLSASLVAASLIACSSQMQPAQQALAGATTAVNAAAADMSKYTPEQLPPLQDRLAALKASFDKKDYSAVLTAAPILTSDANDAEKVAEAKKQATLQALNDRWTDLAAAVPKLIDTVTPRVDALGKMKRKPKDVDLPTAKSALDNATASWQQAQNSHASGDIADAVNQAQDAQQKLTAAATAIKLTLPAAQAPQ